MIVIKDQDFEMEQYKDTPHFDLKMASIVNEGKPNARVEMKSIADGIPFEVCLQRIISHRLLSEGKVYSAIEYINAVNKEVEKISKLVQYIEKPVKKSKKSKDTEDEEEDELEEIIEEDNSENN